jgi:hypothetical protein
MVSKRLEIDIEKNASDTWNQPGTQIFFSLDDGTRGFQYGCHKYILSKHTVNADCICNANKKNIILLQ